MKNLLLTGVLLLASCGVAFASDEPVKVEHLGTNNTLVRLTPTARYLMLPVQDNGEECRVKVIVDGKEVQSLVVRLAQSKVDYSVPLDLGEYQGKNVVLDVVSHQSRSSVRESKGDAAWTSFAVTDTPDMANREKYRPLFHHTPEYGWMNDPNGMFYKDGVWHLYFQWNPYGSKWQNMTWGHSTSTDLVNWTPQPTAIVPDALGAIFSGSCALDPENTAGFGEDAVIAMYTSAAASQVQSLAHSSDGGTTFEKYPGNPTITLETEARDPNMFWNPEKKEWVLTLAHALDHEMLIFTSPDMKEWTLQSSFGKGEGCQDGVWECPDLFPLPVQGTGKTKWVLLCNINPGGPFGGSATQYFVGDFDGKTFKADTDATGKIPTKWMDWGKDNYATVSFSDAPSGRRTVIGWMSNWQYANDVPTMQFRSANTLPRDLVLFEGADGQIYLQSMPSPELDGMRGTLTAKSSAVAVGAKAKNFRLPAANDGICEIQATLVPKKAKTVSLILSNDKGERAVMTYDPQARTLAFDRTASGVTDFSHEFPAVTVAPTFGDGGDLQLRIFVDRSSVEVFADQGRSVTTNLVFPTTPYTTLSLASDGGAAQVKDLKIYSLNPAK